MGAYYTIMENVKDYKLTRSRDSRITKYAILTEGRWTFSSLSTLSFKSIGIGITYAKPIGCFAVVATSETDPMRSYAVGNSGDVVTRDRFGNLDILKEEVFFKKYN